MDTQRVPSKVRSNLFVPEQTLAFAGLSAVLQAQLVQLSRVQHVTQGETIIADGERLNSIGYVYTGMFKMEKIEEGGRAQILGLLVQGHIAGQIFSSNATFAVEAVTDGVIVWFDRQAFEALVRSYPELEHRILLDVLDELDATREWLILLGSPRVVGRVASFLLMLCRIVPPDKRAADWPQGEVVHLPISRADLSSYLGTRPETVSRALTLLARDKIIEAIDRSSFRIVDIGALVDLSSMTIMHSKQRIFTRNVK